MNITLRAGEIARLFPRIVMHTYLSRFGRYALRQIDMIVRDGFFVFEIELVEALYRQIVYN